MKIIPDRKEWRKWIQQPKSNAFVSCRKVGEKKE